MSREVSESSWLHAARAWNAQWNQLRAAHRQILARASHEQLHDVLGNTLHVEFRAKRFTGRIAGRVRSSDGRDVRLLEDALKHRAVYMNGGVETEATCCVHPVLYADRAWKLLGRPRPDRPVLFADVPQIPLVTRSDLAHILPFGALEADDEPIEAVVVEAMRRVRVQCERRAMIELRRLVAEYAEPGVRFELYAHILIGPGCWWDGPLAAEARRRFPADLDVLFEDRTEGRWVIREDGVSIA